MTPELLEKLFDYINERANDCARGDTFETLFSAAMKEEIRAMVRKPLRDIRKEQNSRQMFEEWAVTIWPNDIIQSDDGGYAFTHVDGAWMCWQNLKNL